MTPMQSNEPSIHHLADRGRSLGSPRIDPTRLEQHDFIYHTMTTSIRIIIEGENLDDQQDGDWTISVYRNGNLSAQSGLSGTPEHAFQAARFTALDDDIHLGEDNE